MTRETQASTRIALGQAIEPAEKTAPPLGVPVIRELGPAIIDVHPLQAKTVQRWRARLGETLSVS